MHAAITHTPHAMRTAPSLGPGVALVSAEAAGICAGDVRSSAGAVTYPRVAAALSMRGAPDVFAELPASPAAVHTAVPVRERRPAREQP